MVTTDLRAIVAQTLVTALGDAWTVQGFGSVSDPPARPFMIYKFGETAIGVRGTTASETPLSIWAYDDGADYARIDEALSAVEQALVALASTGTFLQIHWNGRSGDMIDPEWSTLLRLSYLQIASTAP